MAKTTAELVDGIVERYDIPIEEAEPSLVTGYSIEESDRIANPDKLETMLTFHYFGQRDRVWRHEAKVVTTTATIRVS